MNDNYRTMFESRLSAGANEKLPCSENLNISSWSSDMEGHAKKSVERYCELANRTTQQLYKVSTPCSDDHHFKEEELKSVGDLSNVCSQIVLKCLYVARIGRPYIPWSVNKLARSITKWTKACDKRLSRLISYFHHTCEYKQYCHVGNTAKQCRLGLFQDYDFAGDLGDSKSTSGGTLCIFGRYTFVPISWMCKKQISVSHSSTGSEIISLDPGLRLDGISTLDLMNSEETIYQKVFASPPPPPTISFKDNWMNELDSEVAGSSGDSQRTQPKPKPNYQERGDPWSDNSSPRKSRKVPCLVTRTSSTQQERRDPWVDKSPPRWRK